MEKSSINKSIKLSIIIVTYNISEYLIRCLKSIVKWWPKYQTEIIIIDNNSVDNIQDRIEELKIKNLIFFKNKKNVGFSKAVNLGIRRSCGNLLLLLNPDTIILNDSINKLVKYAIKNSKIGIIGGKTLKIDKKEIHRTYFNKINFLTALFEFTSLKKIFPNNIFYKNFYYIGKDENRTRKVYGVSGGFMLIKKWVIKKVGYLEENFFLYLEDIDYGLRTRAKGIKIIYYPKSVIKHEFGATLKNTKHRINVKAWQDSRKFFFRKHFGFFLGNILKFIFTVEDFIIKIKNFLFNEKN